MPLNVQLANAQVKDPQSGQMTPVGLIGSDAISKINTAKNQAVAAIEQKGEETRESIPDDYTALTDEVDGLKTHLDETVDILTTESFTWITDWGMLKNLWKVSDGNLTSDTWRNGYRVASNYQSPIYLYSGTKIVLPSDRRLIYAFSSDNSSGSYSMGSWITGTVTLQNSGYYAIIITSDPADSVAVTTVESFCDGIKVYRPSDGSTVEERLQVIEKAIVKYDGSVIEMESGGFSFNETTGWEKSSYQSQNRIRTKQSIRFEKGTRIITPKNYVLAVLYKFSDTQYYSSGFTGADYICEMTTDYVFVLRTYNGENLPDTIANISAQIKIIAPDRIAYCSDAEYLQKIAEQSNYCNIDSILRTGYAPNNEHFVAPQNSIAGFSIGYDYGYRIMLADVRWTSDGVPVALHDQSINSVARNSDGTEISSTVDIDDITLETADSYDFGIAWGQQFAGEKIMQIEDFVEWCIKRGCKIFLEVKSDGVTQITTKLQSLFAVLDIFNVGNSCIFCIDSSVVGEAVHTKYPKATIAIPFSDGSNLETSFARAATYKDSNEVFVYVYAKEDFSYQITSEMVSAAVENNVDIGLTECKTISNLNSFLSNKNNLAVKWLAIRGMPFSKYIEKTNALA